MPNRGQDPDKTFDIRLTDAVGQHEIYLTRLVFEPALYGSTPPQSARNSLVSRRAGARSPGRGFLSVVLLVGGGLVAVVLLSVAAAHVCRSTAAAAAKPVIVSEKDAVIYDVSRADVAMATAGACNVVIRFLPATILGIYVKRYLPRYLLLVVLPFYQQGYYPFLFEFSQTFA